MSRLLVLLVGAVVLTTVAALSGVDVRPAQAGQPEVRRLAGDARDATAVAVARDGWASSGTAVLADLHDDMAVLVAGHLAARMDAPVLASRRTGIPETTAQALRDLDVSGVVLVGDVEPAEGVEVLHRVTGADPAALSVAALGSGGEDDGTSSGGADGARPWVLASAATFADALAAASLAPANLLLTPPDRLDPGVADVLGGLAPTTVTLLGGPAALPEAIAEDVMALGHAVDRVAGEDRIATAIRTAERAPDRTAMVVSSAGSAADAVAMVPWAARRGGVVLLTATDELSPAVDAHLRSRDGGAAGHGDAAADVVVAGGARAVSDFAVLQVEAAVGGAPPPGAASAVRALTDAEREAMIGPAWREGCPVGLDDLRVVTARRVDLDGVVHDDGRLVVHHDVAEDVRAVLDAAFEARWPIHRLDPIEVFGGDDDASMAANNSSGFNCRVIAGTSTWSQHAYGRAVDLNPVQNPYVRGRSVQPEAGRAFLDRGDVRPGMAVEGDPVVSAFDAIGWGWGGRWSSASDYQHFSRSGG